MASPSRESDNLLPIRSGERFTQNTPIDGDGGGPHDPLMEARVARLEDDVREIKTVLSRLEPMIIRIDERIIATLPTLATKADLADKPGKGYLWTILGVLVATVLAATLGGATLVDMLQR